MPMPNGYSMNMVFDISEDELPIFLAEVDEHLQVLDDVLIRLETEHGEPELVQTVFRSAHTIKGMTGMIGHLRMTDLTHALESVLDGVRKNSIQISTELINVCLATVDALRELREEVVTAQPSVIETTDLILALKNLFAETPESGKTAAKNETPPTTQPSPAALAGARGIRVQAKIDTHSMASAARAFQLLMVLQEAGDIREMQPTQEQIELASSVGDFSAVVESAWSLEQLGAALAKISGVDEILIDGQLLTNTGSNSSREESAPVSPEPAENLSAVAGPNPTEYGRRVTDVGGRRGGEAYGGRSSDLTVRTNVERLDSLMNLVGELITDRNHLHQIRSRLAMESGLNGNFEQFSETVTHLGRITDQLQEEVMRIRMLPIGNILNKFPRMVRDMSQKVGKVIDVVIHGEDVEMDRSMIEEINDPLIHLIRNSVDHGIETPQVRLAAGKPERGTITLTARHEQGRIIITVEDDGGGIDGEKLRQSAVQKGLITAEEAASLTDEQSIDLMFLAGLSTAKKVTDISGRGVGLDIVSTNIQRVNGSIQVETRLGQGTRFQIMLPLTLAIVPSLLVRVQESTFAIPLVMISETLRLEPAGIKQVSGNPVTVLRGSVLSLISLADIFRFSKADEFKKHLFAVVVHSGKQRIGLIVDALLGEEEVVVKPLGAFIGDIPGVSSAAILGNGQVALIVDIFGLFKLAGI